MKVEFDVNLTEKDIFRFNICQAYKGVQGLLSTIFPLFVIAVAVYNYKNAGLGSTMVYIMVGIFLIVYLPVSLWLRSKKVYRTSESLSNTLHFTFTEENISVSQGEQQVEFQWENIYKMIATGKMVLIYTNRIHAYIIPRVQIQEFYGELAVLAKSKLERFRIRMK